MANKNPVMGKEFKNHQKKAYGDWNEPMGKSFGLRLPRSIDKELRAMPPRERMLLMRSAIIEKIKKHTNRE